MASDVYSFLWSVPQGGYHWVEVKVFVDDGDGSRLEDQPRLVLTDGTAIGQMTRIKQYAPLKECTGLYRTFAQIPFQDRDAILAFANEYGNLGIGRMLDVTAKDSPGRLLGVSGETWQDWGEKHRRHATGTRYLGHGSVKRRCRSV